MRALPSVATVCVAVLIAGGCASKPNTRKPIAPSPSDSAFHKLEQLPAEGIVHANDVFTSDALPQAYIEVNEEGRKIGRGTRNRMISARHGASFSDEDLNLRETTYWRFDEQGAAVMTAHIDFKEAALTLFQPPLVLMPAELRAGEPHTTESNLRVVDHLNQRKIKQSGRATRVIEYVSDQKIVLPSGDFRAKRIEIRFNAQFRMANVEELTTWFVVPEHGLVAEQTSTRITVLGTMTTRKHRSIVFMN